MRDTRFWLIIGAALFVVVVVLAIVGMKPTVEGAGSDAQTLFEEASSVQIFAQDGNACIGEVGGGSDARVFTVPISAFS